LHDIMIETPTTTWDDVGGLPRIRDRMRDSVVLPLKSPEAVAKMGVKPPSGFLLFGPPGAGKTLVCKATASEAGATLLATTVSELLTQEGGEVARIKRLFARARQATPAVVVIDEIDRLGFPQGDMTDPGAPRRALNTLLAELDAMCETPGLAVIGLTSRPTLLDTALLRSGRLEELIYVPPPDREGRREILTVLTRNMPLAADVNLDALADDTDRYTGADLCELVRRAGLLAARNPDQKEVPAACLTKARDEIGPSVTSEMERAYETVAATLKQEPPRRQGIGFALPGQTG
jgi:transitional endoplasmic reticulum ATPase